MNRVAARKFRITCDRTHGTRFKCHLSEVILTSALVAFEDVDCTSDGTKTEAKCDDMVYCCTINMMDFAR